MKKCPLCEKESVHEKKVRDYKYPTPMGLITIEGHTKLEECKNCKEIFIPGALINEWNHLVLKRLSKKQSRFTPHELQFIFSILPYSQAELAQATGKERSTLTKYKTGENPLDPLFEDILQQILIDHLAGKETTLERLKERSRFIFENEKLSRLKLN
ncbi:MAG: hypothetical protein HY072_02725 [Deltaproteobacteria bacterium]|nr:hypothetical protein [Deltaproteobacteria bacterium]